MIDREILRKETERAKGAVKEQQDVSGLQEAVVDAAIVAPQGATMSFADEALGLVDEDLAERYRGMVKEARERSPIATGISETAASFLPTRAGMAAAAKIGPAASSLAQGTIGSMTEAFGASLGEEEDKLTKPAMLKAAGRAGIVGATSAGLKLGKSIKNAFFPSGKSARAGAIATKSSAFKVGRNDDIVEVTNDLYQSRALDPRKMFFDVKDLKFKPMPIKGNVKGNSLSEENYLYDLRDRMGDALDKTNQASSEIFRDYHLKIKSDPFSFNEVTGAKSFKEPILKYLAKHPNRNAMMKKVNAELDDLNQHFSIPEYDFSMGFKESELPGLFMDELNDRKLGLYTQARKVLANPNSSDLDKTAAEAKIQVAHALRSFISDTTNSPKLDKINNSARQMHLLVDAIEGSINSQRSGKTSWIGGSTLETVLNRALEAASGPASVVRRSGVSDVLDRLVPDSAGSAAMAGLPRLAGREFGRLTQGGGDQSMIQSTISQAMAEPLSEKIDKIRIPRDTDSVLRNQQAILAKVAQSSPGHLEQFIQMYKSPHSIPDIMPILSTQLPQLFEPDIYNRFDGKIFDPAAQQKARKQIMADPNISNTQKMGIINHLNSTGELLYE